MQRRLISAQGLVLPVPKPVPLPQDPGAVTVLKNFRDRVQSGIQKYRGNSVDSRPQPPSHKNDFARLARRICGKSIGVVLGGGGARGMSHIVNVHSSFLHTRANSGQGCASCFGGIWHSDRSRCRWVLCVTLQILYVTLRVGQAQVLAHSLEDCMHVKVTYYQVLVVPRNLAAGWEIFGGCYSMSPTQSSRIQQCVILCYRLPLPLKYVPFRD